MTKYKFILLLLFSVFMVGCGVEQEQSEARLSEVAIHGGNLTQSFSPDSDEELYTIEVAPLGTSLGITFDLEDGSQITAVRFTQFGLADPEPSLVTHEAGNFVSLPLSGDEFEYHLFVDVDGDDVALNTYIFRIIRALEGVPQQLTQQNLNLNEVLSEIFDPSVALLDHGEISDIAFNGYHYAVGFPDYDAYDPDTNTVIVDTGLVVILVPDSIDENGVITSWDTVLIQPPELSAGDNFGKSLQFASIDFLFVGAPGEGGDATSAIGAYNDNSPNSGALFTYELNSAGQWAPEVGSSDTELMPSHYIKSPIIADDAFFAEWIATVLRDNGHVNIVVPARGDDMLYSYVSAYDDDNQMTFSHVDSITLSFLSSTANLQYSVSSNYIAFAQSDFAIDLTPGDSDPSLASDVGRVTIYPWTESAMFPDDADEVVELMGQAPSAQFGAAIQLEDDRIVIGAPGAGVGGQVSFYSPPSTDGDVDDDALSTWLRDFLITGASNTMPGDAFGSSLHLKGNRLLVGATGSDGDAMTDVDTDIDTSDPDHVDNSGSVYTYWFDELESGAFPANRWDLGDFLKEDDAEADANFGADFYPRPNGTIGVSSPNHPDGHVIHIFY